MQRLLLHATCCLLSAAFGLLSGGAAAETIAFEGNYGLERQLPPVAEAYDATGATVYVEQGSNNACWNIRDPDGTETPAVFTGGRCIGHGHNRTMARRPLYNRGNGAGIRSEIRRFTLRRFYSEYAWDPIKPAVPDAETTIEEVWITGGRDDCIEADQHPNRVSVRRSMIENCHSLISVTPGKSRPLAHPALIEFEDSVLSVGCMLDNNEPCLERETRAGYPWSRRYDPDTGEGGRSNSQVFKVRGFGSGIGCGNGITVRFRGNHFAAGATAAAPGPDGVFYTSDDVLQENGFHTPVKNLRIFQCMDVTADSTDNTFYWLGGCDYDGLRMVDLHGACVPAEFALDPSVWTAASNSWDEWLAARNRFIDGVWQGETVGREPSPRRAATGPVTDQKP